jgi:hypothetical protein
MLLKYVNSHRITVIVLFLLVPVLYWIPSMVHLTPLTPAANDVTFGKWISVFNYKFSGLASFIALLLLIVNGYLLLQLNTVHFFIPFRTQLPLFFYLLLTLGINQLHQLTPALVASTLIILMFYRIFHAYKTEGISLNFVDAGLLISLASLFYFPAIFFFPALLTGLVIMRPFIWREWVFAVIGLLIPYLITFSGYYLLDIPGSELFRGMETTFTHVSRSLRLSQVINWSYILLFTLIGSYYMSNAIDSMKIHARVFFEMFLVFFLFSVLIFLLVPGAGTAMVYFVAIPLSYLFSHYFIKCERNWINELFLDIFLLLFIWQRVM